MKEVKNKLIGGSSAASAVLGSILSISCWVAPVMFMSLGLSGIGLSYISLLTPYRNFFRLFSVISLAFSHYRLAKGKGDKTTEIFLGIVTVIVVISLLSPILMKVLD